MENLLSGILKSYKDTDIISFPTKDELQEMSALLELKRKPMPGSALNMDGKHAICKGLHIFDRLSQKFNFHHACFNLLFVTERVMGSVCAFTLDSDARKHDINVLRESTWYQNLAEMANGAIIMAGLFLSNYPILY